MLLRAIDGSAPLLYSARKDRGSRGWACFGGGRLVPDNCFLSSRSSCRTRAYPARGPDGGENLDPSVRARFSAAAGRDVDAESFVHYALALLAAPSYRARHADDLRADHPRIAPPDGPRSFDAVRAAGRALFDAFDRSVCDPAAEPVVIGHREVRCTALAVAIADAEAAVAPLLAD